MLLGFKQFIRPNQDSNTEQTLSRAPKEKVGAEGERKAAGIGKQQGNNVNTSTTANIEPVNSGNNTKSPEDSSDRLTQTRAENTNDRTGKDLI